MQKKCSAYAELDIGGVHRALPAGQLKHLQNRQGNLLLLSSEMIVLLIEKCNFPMTLMSGGWSVGWLAGRLIPWPVSSLVCHNFLKGP